MSTPSTDVVAAPDMGRGVVRGVPIAERVQYARLLAESGLLPAQYRQRPANVLYAVEWGTMLGIHPMAAITGVHIIEGKPSASAALISALVRRAGHRLRVRVTGRGDDLIATAQIIRHDDPEFTYEVSWDRARAVAAGLWGKATWKSYPEAMLKARAISEVAREACEEALCGVHYTPEELGAVVDIEGEVVGEVNPGSVQQQGATAPAPQQQEPQQESTAEPRVQRLTAEQLAAERAAADAAAAEQHAAGPEPFDADAVRDAVFTAASRASLRLAMIALGAVQVTDGREGWDRARLEATTVADAQGNETNGWELMRSVAAGLPADDPQPEVHEGELVDEGAQP